MNNKETEKADVGQNNGNNEFLQSIEWLKFQEAFGRKTFSVRGENFSAKIIEHILPIVGRYFYIPRGPVLANSKFQIPNSKQISNQKSQIKNELHELIYLAKKENAGWIRIEPSDLRFLDLIGSSLRVVKSPYDVQPKEVFMIDISKSEEQLLAEMKSKTRYNIGIAKKRNVQVFAANNKNAIDEFLKLTKEMAIRQGITTHPEEYYRKMFKVFPQDMLKLYCAEYDGKVIAANLILFFGDTATYLHGASSNENRNVMAPFLLQWQAILDAKERGCMRYDFGGVQTRRIKHKKHSDLSGVTVFKMGFSPVTEPIVFPGTYDIIISQRRYSLYKGLQRAKMIMKKFRR